MKKLKFYINDESKLNEYEKKQGKISYKTLVRYLFTDMILCNNIEKVDNYLFDSVVCGEIYDEECGEYTEIYQYFIVDFPNFALDFIEKYCKKEVLLFYSDLLDLYILGVDHFGTGWDYVLTDFEYTTTYEGSMQYNLYR